MAREKICAAILAAALAVVPAVAMAGDSNVEKGSISSTGTGVAVDQVAVGTEATGFKEGDEILFVGGVLVAVLVGGVLIWVLRDGDGGVGTSTATGT